MNSLKDIKLFNPDSLKRMPGGQGSSVFARGNNNNFLKNPKVIC